MIKFEGFYILDSYKKFGALEDEKDKCFLHRRNYSQKSYTLHICLLQCIFQRGTIKPLENFTFSVYSLG